MVLQILSFRLQKDIHANGFLENILIEHVVSVRKHVRIPPNDKHGRERRWTDPQPSFPTFEASVV